MKDMVWVPGGTFLMGSEDFYPEERPAHRVTVGGFWIDRHPVTNAQFRRFVKASGGPGSTLHGRDRHPVVQVCYADALAYAAWAGRALASEAEWEYAARQGEAVDTATGHIGFRCLLRDAPAGG
jgi:formylglycine-generating enzyme